MLASVHFIHLRVMLVEEAVEIVRVGDRQIAAAGVLAVAGDGKGALVIV